MLPAHDRLDWKVIASFEHSSLFGLVVSNEGKTLCNIATWQTSSCIPPKSRCTASLQCVSSCEPSSGSSWYRPEVEIKVHLHLRFLVAKNDTGNVPTLISVPLVHHQEALFEGKGSVHLLVMLTCLVTKINNIFNVKSSWCKLVSTRRSTALSLPLH